MKTPFRLALSWRRQVPIILQTEVAECGLACLSMVAGFHGAHQALSDLRRKFPVSTRGVSIASLVRAASRLHLVGRPVKLSLDGLHDLRLPCVLHWEFQHYVVLVRVSRDGITIHDPASGLRRLSWRAVSDSFTGVALELSPSATFTPKKIEAQHLPLGAFAGRIGGLIPSISQIALLALAVEILSLASPFFLQLTIDQVLSAGDRGLLMLLGMSFGVAMLMHQVFIAVRSWMITHLSSQLSVQWRINVFRHLIHLPTIFFERRTVGDISSRFSSIEAIQKTLTTSFIETLIDGVMVTFTLAMMFVYSWWLPFLSIGCMGVYMISRYIALRPLRSATAEQLIHAARQHTHFLETIRGARSLKLFDGAEERSTAWARLLIAQTNAGIAIEKLNIQQRFFNGFLLGGERILVISFAATLVLNNEMSVGVLVAFVTYREQFCQRVSSFVDGVFNVRMLRVHLERLADIVLTPADTVEDSIGHQPCGQLANFSLELKGVSYRYARFEPFVLNDFSECIEQGESVAITGPSGCGKSTLVGLLLGTIMPSGGAVYIGGVDIHALGMKRYRSYVAAVLQDDVLLAGTVLENISFFSPEIDLDWAMECARIAAVHGEIAVMPMAYQTLISELGTSLSGGQKQRILLARALYKRPKILILDEATSHLNVTLEREVNASIQALKITRIIIAHRPETIRSADREISLCVPS